MTLAVRDIVKSFPATRALDGVSLAIRPGEIHGLVGENGAGKSTLMKILAGLLRPDEGSVLLDGVPVRLRSVREASDERIVLIHQELNLVDDLTVAENIGLGREPTRFGLLRRRRMAEVAREALSSVGATIPPWRRVGTLSVAEQQLVEIAKAVASGARYLLMDEPTAVLSERETAALFRLMRRLAESGTAIVYISHLLAEVISVCGTISVLRDGRLVASVRPDEIDEAALANLLVGRELAAVFPARTPPPTAERSALVVRGLAVASEGRTAVRDVSFAVGAGEILGIAGLVGSGRTETAETIVGLRRRSAGQIIVGGRPARRRMRPRRGLRRLMCRRTDRREHRAALSPRHRERSERIALFSQADQSAGVAAVVGYGGLRAARDLPLGARDRPSSGGARGSDAADSIDRPRLLRRRAAPRVCPRPRRLLRKSLRNRDRLATLSGDVRSDPRSDRPGACPHRRRCPATRASRCAPSRIPVRTSGSP
jgi:ribose transport system ATP-binding protein